VPKGDFVLASDAAWCVVVLLLNFALTCVLLVMQGAPVTAATTEASNLLAEVDAVI